MNFTSPAQWQAMQAAAWRTAKASTPTTAKQDTLEQEAGTDGRAALVDVLRRRGEGGDGAQPTEAPACAGARASNLPALAADLPADDTSTPQDCFSRDVQRAFLEALSIVGSVRDAARRVGVSHMTAYRARRKCAAFRACWDAALVCAIPHAEEELTCRAIDGVEEDVMYRGEVVHTRIRKDPRLLLAHLGRLDKKGAQPRAAALAECFDDALEALENGGDLPGTAPEMPPETPETVLPSGQCNMCNTPPAQEGPDEGSSAARDARLADKVQDPRWDPSDDEDAHAAWREAEANCPCVGKRNGTHRDQDHYRWEEGEGLRPVENDSGEGPCCSMPEWPRCRACPHVPEWLREIGAMEDERPANVLHPDELDDWDLCEQALEAQAAAYAQGLDEWWSVTTRAELAELRERAVRVAGVGELVENRAAGEARPNGRPQRPEGARIA